MERRDRIAGESRKRRSVFNMTYKYLITSVAVSASKTRLPFSHIHHPLGFWACLVFSRVALTPSHSRSTEREYRPTPAPLDAKKLTSTVASFERQWCKKHGHCKTHTKACGWLHVLLFFSLRNCINIWLCAIGIPVPAVFTVPFFSELI